MRQEKINFSKQNVSLRKAFAGHIKISKIT